jgi:hypothetical protein
VIQEGVKKMSEMATQPHCSLTGHEFSFVIALRLGWLHLGLAEEQRLVMTFDYRELLVVMEQRPRLVPLWAGGAVSLISLGAFLPVVSGMPVLSFR